MAELITGTLTVPGGPSQGNILRTLQAYAIMGDSLWYMVSEDLAVSGEEDSADDPAGWEFYDEVP